MLYSKFFLAPSIRWRFTEVILLYADVTLASKSRKVLLTPPFEAAICFSNSMAAEISATIDTGLGLVFSALTYPVSELDWQIKILSF